MLLGDLKKITMYLHYFIYRLFIVDDVLDAGNVLASPKSAGNLRSGLGPADRNLVGSHGCASTIADPQKLIQPFAPRRVLLHNQKLLDYTGHRLQRSRPRSASESRCLSH